MKLLVIGNLGYIGPIVVKHFRKKYPNAIIEGYDIGYFIQNNTDNGVVGDTLLNKQYFGDVRHFDYSILNNYDSVIYLAAISNDPMGNAYEKATLDINFTAAIDIAKNAKQGGVQNFVFASSCSVYGFADENNRTEKSEVNPLTAYAKSKVYAEIGLKPLANSNFKITCLRFATACGYSDRLRLDLVLNDFVASAFYTNKITILSDGTPWRPLIHIKDMALAMEWAIIRENGGDFLIINIGSNSWNYQVKDLANEVKKMLPNTTIEINENAPPDKRSYRVDFKLYETLAATEYQPKINIQIAIQELSSGLKNINFVDVNFRDSNLVRLKSIQNLLKQNIIDKDLKRI